MPTDGSLSLGSGGQLMVFFEGKWVLLETPTLVRGPSASFTLVDEAADDLKLYGPEPTEEEVAEAIASIRRTSDASDQ